jgi:hypothetical protein
LLLPIKVAAVGPVVPLVRAAFFLAIRIHLQPVASVELQQVGKAAVFRMAAVVADLDMQAYQRKRAQTRSACGLAL